MIHKKIYFLILIVVLACVTYTNIEGMALEGGVKLISSNMNLKECEDACEANKQGCKYVNRPVHLVKHERGPCYHTTGVEGQYALPGGSNNWNSYEFKNAKVRKIETVKRTIGWWRPGWSYTSWINLASLPPGAKVTEISFRAKIYGRHNCEGPYIMLDNGSRRVAWIRVMPSNWRWKWYTASRSFNPPVKATRARILLHSHGHKRMAHQTGEYVIKYAI